MSMTVLAAATTMETLRALPPSVWLKLGLAIAVIVGSVILVRRLAEVNKMVLGIGFTVGGAVLFFSWVYNRNEPAFLTPLVEQVAPFLPSKGAYGSQSRG